MDQVPGGLAAVATVTPNQDVVLAILQSADLLHERQEGDVIQDGLTLQLVAKSKGPKAILAVVHLQAGHLRLRFTLHRDLSVEPAVLIGPDEHVRKVLDARANQDLTPARLADLLADLARP